MRAMIRLTALLTFVVASPAGAQIGFEGLLKDINDIAVSFTCWNTNNGIRNKDDCPSGKNGYGLEVLFRVGVVPLSGTNVVVSNASVVEKARKETCTAPGQCSTTTESEVVAAKSQPATHLELELALGYSQFSGFESSDPSYDLKGLVREIPSVALYATYTRALPVGQKARRMEFRPYAGVQSGLIQLFNTTIFDPHPSFAADSVVVYNTQATAFQLGGVLGAALSFSNKIHVFYQRGLNMRRFPSLTWTATNKNLAPAKLPRSLDFSGQSESWGVQVSIR